MNHSLWRDALPELSSTPIDKDKTTDVCIIGGGIAGISIAHALSKNNVRVVIVDAGAIGGGATSDTTAHITWRLDDDYKKLCEYFSKEDARKIGESHRQAIQIINKNVSEEQIDCNFEFLSGYLVGTQLKSNDLFLEELKTLHLFGFAEVDKLSSCPNEIFPRQPALHFPRQAQFHPIRYINGLCRTIRANHGHIYSHTKIVDIQTKDEIVVTTENEIKIRAKHLVVATNTPINHLVAMHTKQAPYQSYVVAMRMPRYSYPYALYWDDEDPYHYARFVSASDYDLIVVGGEDHKTGQEDDADARFTRLINWTKVHFPKVEEVAYQWCGQVYEPMDRVAYIGRSPGHENVFLATGFSGNGMTYGTISGSLIPDLILGKQNPYEKVYDPSRISTAAIPTFTKENANVAAQFKDWLKPGEVANESEISPGEGAIIRHGLHLSAVYKDEKGQCTALSAKCTHLGCVVHWNPTAKTWDCPCHGSRFNKKGRVINGPAIENLALEKVESSTALISEPSQDKSLKV